MKLENLNKYKELVYIGLCLKLNDLEIKIPSNIKSITILENTAYYPFDSGQKVSTFEISTFKRNGA